MIAPIEQNISPVTALPGLLAENRPAAVNQLVEEELPLLSTELESLTQELNTFIEQTNLAGENIEINKSLAQEAASIATASANYKGDWVNNFETTGYSIGMSVTFTDGYNYVSKINNNLISPITLQNTNEWNFIEAVNPNNYYLKTETYTKTEVNTLHEINNKTDKATPINTDNLLIEEVDGLFKKLSWDNLKATLKTYFDTLYPAISGYPAFSATKTGQSFTSSVWTKLACNVEQYDNTTAYDNATNFRFTPLKAGKYRITVQMQSESVNTGGNIAIYKNGTVFKKLIGITGTSIGDTFIGSYTVELNGTTDYIEAYGVWNSENTAGSSFQAEYILGV